MAEDVEKVRKLNIFGIMIQYWRIPQINISASVVYQSNSCAKIDGPDFFNSLSYKQPSRAATDHGRFTPISGSPGLVAECRSRIAPGSH
jgi:hypothetical protein